MLKAAMNRGFSSWAANSPRISFTDVTDECEKLGRLNEDCPLAELWVTAIGASSASNSGSSTGRRRLLGANDNLTLTFTEALGTASTSAALATPTAQYQENFMYTNGVKPASGRVIETYGAVISFNPSLCWYLDSTFCARFHSLKTLTDKLNPNELLWVGRGILAAIFGLAFLVMFCQICAICRARTDRKKGKHSKLAAVLDAIHRRSMIGIALRLVLLVAPPAFYWQIFLPCWECYDFEAAATHEVGHVLGLSHPDAVETALCTEQQCGDAPGQNVYTSVLSQGGRLNATTCMSPWDWVVPGVPAGFDGDEGEVRPSIMKALTQHNPRVCLSEDDLEALNTLYPDCTHSISTPVCDKTAHNIGWVRLGVWVIVPVIISMLILICIFSYASRRQIQRLDSQILQRMQRSQQLAEAKNHGERIQAAHIQAKKELKEQKRTEKVRIEREARRLSQVYIRQSIAAPPKGMLGHQGSNTSQTSDQSEPGGNLVAPSPMEIGAPTDVQHLNHIGADDDLSQIGYGHGTLGAYSESLAHGWTNMVHRGGSLTRRSSEEEAAAPKHKTANQGALARARGGARALARKASNGLNGGRAGRNVKQSPTLETSQSSDDVVLT
jgi:hypothetical protein